MSVVPVDPRHFIDDYVRRSYSPRQALDEIADSLCQASLEATNRAFTEELFARRLSRVAFRRGYGR